MEGFDRDVAALDAGRNDQDRGAEALRLRQEFNRLMAKGDRESRQIATEVIAKEYRDLGQYDYEQEVHNNIHGQAEAQAEEYSGLKGKALEERREEVDRHLNLVSKVSDEEFTYVVPHQNHHYTDSRGRRLEVPNEVLKIDHKGKSASQIAQEARGRGMSTFEYLCQQRRVPIALDAYKGSKPEKPEPKTPKHGSPIDIIVTPGFFGG